VCADSGLRVVTLGAGTQRELSRMLPHGAVVAGPVDTTAAVTPDAFRQCLERVAADDGVDAVLALTVPTAIADLMPAACAADVGKPLVLTVLDQSEAIRLLPRAPGGLPCVPAFAYPASAARALAHAVRYGAWRARPPGHVPEFGGLRPDDARALILAFLAQAPAGGWLPPAEVVELLGCYGVPLVPTRLAAGEEAAVRAAAGLGGQVVLKADVRGLVHKSDAGAVRLGLRGEDDVRRAFRSFAETFGDRLCGVLVQPLIQGGTEVIIGVVQEPVFGPLTVFGLGGVATEVIGDHAARLTPLTDADADELIRSVRAAPLLLGHRGVPAADLGALADMLLRISRLADDLPEVAELDLNPVIARPDGVFAVDARIRVTAAAPSDPYLRQLR
jgi:acyl-CoA synthetase (NDP forming)